MGSFSWERLWRGAGVQFVILFIVAFIIYGDQPKVGASATDLASFYDGDRTRIMFASVIFGLGLLNLLWFAAALASTLRDAGQGGWGSAATAASAVFAGAMFLLITVGATLAYSVAGSANDAGLTSALNDLSWVLTVVASFPAAMLIMAGSFGLWRAKLISNTPFYLGVAAVIIVLLGGTTWASSGFWAPDGAYNRWVSTLVGLAWVAVVSGFLYSRAPSAAGAPRGAAVPAP